MRLKTLAQSTRKGVETPSKLDPIIEISQAEFSEKYADSAKIGLVSRSGDGNNPTPTSVYHGPKGRVVVI